MVMSLLLAATGDPSIGSSGTAGDLSSGHKNINLVSLVHLASVMIRRPCAINLVNLPKSSWTVGSAPVVYSFLAHERSSSTEI